MRRISEQTSDERELTGNQDSEYGFSVSLIDTTGFIGAPEAIGPPSVYPGAVYVRDLRDSDDSNQQKVNPEVPFNGAEFGSDVDAAGTYLVVGSPGYSESLPPRNGQAEIFRRESGGDYTSLGTIGNPDATAVLAQFGKSVAVAADGATIAVGAIGARVAKGGSTTRDFVTTYLFTHTVLALTQ